MSESLLPPAFDDWIIIAIGGVSSSGKTTLATKIQEAFPASRVINQDDYFYPIDSPHHVKVVGLDHNNYDILSALNMEQMYGDTLRILQEDSGSKDSIKICVIEGFTILSYEPIVNLCNLKYALVLDREECLKRRNQREYDPPDIPGYFEICVWPEFLKHKEELEKQSDITYLDGTRDDLLDIVLRDINSFALKKS